MQRGVFFFADVVYEKPALTGYGLFNHFHPQAELVWFRKVKGHVLIDGTEVPLTDHQAMFIPSMQVHAFVTDEQERHWVLLQFEPFLVEAVLRQPLGKVLAQPCRATLDSAGAARMDMLCDWLMAIRGNPARGAEAQRLLELILMLVAGAAGGQEQPLTPRGGSATRLQPAMALIHGNPGQPPGLTEAARACNLTGSYFSRLFKAQMGMGFSAYVQMHRLNLAARRLLESDEPIAQVAYAVGFSSPAYFSTSFFDRFGVAPREYRRLGAAQRGRVQENETLPPAA